jgi:hypothetical protein
VTMVGNALSAIAQHGEAATKEDLESDN